MSPSDIAPAGQTETLAQERRTEDFKDGLIREIPNLRAFAASLSGSMQLADDLVQDTLLKAWGNSDKFEPGTSLRAWLFTILRNTYYSLYRKRGREVQDSEGTYAERMATHGNQESHLDLADFRKALAKLPEEQREVLIMVGATGLSYEEAAEICGVAIGTIKSRVNRARTKLAELLSIGSVDDLGPGRTNAAAMQRVGSEPVGS
ncbi:sigma-70 family RNA polymerase sigma factor [Bosea sp. ASV33]|jgi:RNA polymerase sigma-70 factor (ECF subfamily)|uniref:sigma-70 family RNA polymerase sigma factor n=1 Tax=Bosea sp. ASV33 TaxID=2795106 RepID=UPI0018EC5687|nr:sigma-70 family RNA polymerase sigma factor [Bosea sp. ASV33]